MPVWNPTVVAGRSAGSTSEPRRRPGPRHPRLGRYKLPLKIPIDEESRKVIFSLRTDSRTGGLTPNRVVESWLERLVSKAWLAYLHLGWTAEDSDMSSDEAIFGVGTWEDDFDKSSEVEYVMEADQALVRAIRMMVAYFQIRERDFLGTAMTAGLARVNARSKPIVASVAPWYELEKRFHASRQVQVRGSPKAG
jgi:hypothetical protein